MDELNAVACRTLRRNLSVARQILGRASESLGGDGAQEMALRLAKDMFPLGDQIKLSAHFALVSAARLRGALPSGLADAPGGWTSAEAMLAAALEDIAAAEREPGMSAKADVEFTAQGRPVRCPLSYLLFAYLIPSQYFHLSMTYALLRRAGVPLGKIDYLGRDVFDGYAVA